MELFVPFGFWTILVESIKLLSKNGKLMALIAILSIVLQSSLSYLLLYSMGSLADDMIVDFMPDPNSFDPASFAPKTGFDVISPRFRKDAALMLLVEVVFVIAMSIVAFVAGISTVILSAASYANKPLSLKEFLACIWRTWTRPLVTTLYIPLLSIVCVFIAAMLISPLVILNTTATITLAIVVGIAAFVLFLYCSVPWFLAFVVSVVEESCSGFKALGRAADLVKGKKGHGFLLNVAYVIVCWIVIGGCSMAVLGKKNSWLGNHVMVFELLVQTGMCSANLFMVVAYTVIYFQCKKIHGEEVELHGSVIYTKLPTTQPHDVKG